MNKLKQLKLIKFTRFNTNYSVNKYPFLSELGITELNHGVYSNGKWKGDGEAITSYNPSNGEAIAQVTQVFISF